MQGTARKRRACDSLNWIHRTRCTEPFWEPLSWIQVGPSCHDLPRRLGASIDFTTMSNSQVVDDDDIMQLVRLLKRVAPDRTFDCTKILGRNGVPMFERGSRPECRLWPKEAEHIKKGPIVDAQCHGPPC